MGARQQGAGAHQRSQLRRTHTEKVDFAQMEPQDRQAFLRNLNEPPHLKLTVPAKPKTSKKRSAPRKGK